MSRFQELKSSGSEAELDRQEVLSIPEMKLQRAVLPSDVRKVIVGEEGQQEWSPSLDQEDPPGPPHIKEEQEELWTSQEGEQLQGLEEADITKFLFTPVPVKSENYEEKPQSSQLHQRQTEQMETGADGEDRGGPEPARNSHPDLHLQPETEDSEDWNYTTEHESSVHLGKIGSTQAESHKCVGPQSSQLHQQDKTKDSSDTEDSDDWSNDIREPPAGPKSLKINEFSKSGVRCKTNENPLSCSLCGKALKGRKYLKRRIAAHTVEKRFSCSLCEKCFKWNENVSIHMAVHTGEKLFSCSVCKKRFKRKADMKRHMAVHTGDKPFQCLVCEKAFTEKRTLTQHKFIHSTEKTFKCSVCGKGFTQRPGLKQHMNVHKAEKLFSCSVCGKSFKQKRDMKEHMAVHTGEKPFKCSVCEKAFTLKGNLTQHMGIHSAEKRFCCSVCDKRFTWRHQLAKHKCVCPQSSQLHPTEQNREAEPGASM